MRIRATIVCEWNIDLSKYQFSEDVYEILKIVRTEYKNKKLTEHDILDLSDLTTIKINAMDEVR